MREIQWQVWPIILFGVWLLVAPLVGVGVFGDVAAINSYLTGAAVLILGMSALVRPALWQEYTVLILSFWLLIAPFALEFTNLAAPVWNHIIVGLLLGSAALVATLEHSGKHESHNHGHKHASH